MSKIEKRLEYAKKFVKKAASYTNFRKAEAYIIGFIFNKFPEDSILATNSGEINIPNSEYCWVIDINDKHVSIDIKTDEKVEETVIFEK